MTNNVLLYRGGSLHYDWSIHRYTLVGGLYTGTVYGEVDGQQLSRLPKTLDLLGLLTSTCNIGGNAT